MSNLRSAKRKLSDEEDNDAENKDNMDVCPAHVSQVMQNLDNIIQRILFYLPMKAVNTASR